MRIIRTTADINKDIDSLERIKAAAAMKLDELYLELREATKYE